MTDTHEGQGRRGNPNFRRRPGELDRVALLLLDGKVHALVPGVDFTRSIKAQRTYLWKAANGENLKIKTMVQGGVFYVQATDMFGNPLPEGFRHPYPTLYPS